MNKIKNKKYLMQEKQTNFSLDKNGVFYKPTLADYNKGLKQSIYFHQERILELKLRANQEILRLKKEIEDVKKFRGSQIASEKKEIAKRKAGLTQKEFDEEAIRTEQDLRKFKKDCEKEVA